jgi:iron complex outermembrane receptor protein
LLMDLSGRPISVTLDNGVQSTNANGFASGCTYCIADNGNTGNRAIYVADEWKVTDRLKLDAGARFEYQDTSFAFQSPSTGFVGNNPLAAYNYGVETANGPQVKYAETWTLPSFTVGGIYKLAQDASVFARINEGGQFPFFDQIRGSDPGLPPPVTKIAQAELGFKTVGTLYSAFVNLFADRFTNLFQQTRTFAGVPTNSVGGSRTYGLEYEFSLRPLRGMQISLSGNAQHARYQNFDDAQDPGINGKMVEYQPASQWRLTPSYVIPLGDNSLKLYGSYSFHSPHWDDQQNTDRLPSYYTIDAGAFFLLGEKFEFRLSGANLTNQIGLTCGAAGRSVALPGFQPYATTVRSLFGRNIEFSARMRF